MPKRHKTKDLIFRFFVHNSFIFVFKKITHRLFYGLCVIFDM